MMIGIIGVIIGILLLAIGGYYLVKEKNDPESKKIYSIVVVVGIVILIVGVLKIVVIR